MGLFSGKPKRPQLAPWQVWGSASRVTVGDAYYPEAYRKVKVGREYAVALEPDPGNEHDPNAVKVILEGKVCGYLSASTAKWFHPLALIARERGFYLWTNARVELLGGDPGMRLYSLPTEREFKELLGLPMPPEPARGKLKRLGKSAAVIDSVLGGRESAVVQVVLTTEETPSGKYAGQPMIRAMLDGQTLGLIPAQYRDECPDLFALVEQAPRSAEADVRMYDERPWVRVTVTPTI